MIKQFYLIITVFVSIFLLLSCQGMMRSIGMVPMGSDKDIEYSHKLWKALEGENIVGNNSKTEKLILGAAPPHGWILEIFNQELIVDNYRGFLIVKKNYGTIDNKIKMSEVEEDRNKYLTSITVMFKREKGYDEENLNWFWAKYYPDGKLFKKNKMMMSIAIAGRVGKGKSEGCIPCHNSAGAGDYIFYSEIKLPNFNYE